jgi:hypothetical protein
VVNRLQTILKDAKRVRLSGFSRSSSARDHRERVEAAPTAFVSSSWDSDAHLSSWKRPYRRV